MKEIMLKEDLHDDQTKMRAMKTQAGARSRMKRKKLIETQEKTMDNTESRCEARIRQHFQVQQAALKFMLAGIEERPSPITYEESPAPTPTYVHHYPFRCFSSQYPANGVGKRILHKKFFHMFSPSLSTAVTNINQQNQAPLSSHRGATSFPRSIAKTIRGRSGYFMEILKTLSITLGTQLFRSRVIKGAIQPRPSQPECTSLSQAQNNLDGADSTCGVPGTKAFLSEEKGVALVS